MGVNALTFTPIEDQYSGIYDYRSKIHKIFIFPQFTISGILSSVLPYLTPSATIYCFDTKINSFAEGNLRSNKKMGFRVLYEDLGQNPRILSCRRLESGIEEDEDESYFVEFSLNQTGMLHCTKKSSILNQVLSSMRVSGAKVASFGLRINNKTLFSQPIKNKEKYATAHRICMSTTCLRLLKGDGFEEDFTSVPFFDICEKEFFIQHQKA